MKPVESRDYSRDLIRVLTELETLHQSLAELIDRKIDRMRSGDVTEINACTAREQELVGRIGEQEGLRRVLTDRIARSFGMSPQKARRMTASQLAERMAQPWASELLAVAERLQRLTTRIENRNRMAGRLSGAILEHMDAVLSAMTAPRPATGAYGRQGVRLSAGPTRLFETVG
ncbi:MAG: flagellar protein FlgN [bacterium]|nr:flagellar protein FlgN [bacterium]